MKMADEKENGEENTTNHKYIDADFHINLTSALNQLKLKEHLCDIFVKCQDERFHAHKIVLAAASQYFYAMFAGGLSESKPTLSEVISSKLVDRVAYRNYFPVP